MSTTAIRNFVAYVKQYRSVPLHENSKIVIVADEFNRRLTDAIYQELRRHFPSSEWLLVNDQSDIQAAIPALTSAALGLVFYDDAQQRVSHVAGNPLFADLLPVLEHNLADKNRPRTIHTFHDVAPIFDELYDKPPGFYVDLNQHLIQRFNESGIVRLTANHSYVEFHTDNLSNWSSADGLETSFYPAEVANYAKDMTGTIQFTGIIISTLPYTQKYGLITQPITLKIDNAQLIEFDCQDPSLKQDLAFYFDRSPMNRKVSEIGFGTNLGLSKLRPINCVPQERFAGFHLGFGGESNQGKNDSIHLDMIFDHGEIRLNHETLFRNGQFELAC